MQRTLLPVLVLISLGCFAQTQTFHDFTARTILGDQLSFSTYYGKKVMVVNTATYCSYTYQYEELESLYTMYKDTSNFMIVGFPCNDFGFQEPGNDSTVNAFCIDEYGIDFQMMSKVTIVRNDTADVYKWLQNAEENGVQDASVTWNFNKFLIDEAGHWVAHYAQQTSPFHPDIIAWLKSPTVIDTTDTTSTSIVELEMKMKAEVVSGTLTVSFQNLSNSNITVELYAASGQFISTLHNGMITDKEKVTADISRLANGIYLVRVMNTQGTKTVRVAVNN